jgi:hypothetical protein
VNRIGRRGLPIALALALCSVATAVAADRPFTDDEKSYWAYQPVRRPAVPSVRSRSWVTTDVDAFILAALEKKGIRPAPPADKVTLLRRATFDLTGLPPTPAEVKAFLGDRSPRSFEKVVDRLLASPQYGEKWGRHWLDLARYAESEGFKSDETRPNAWRYRDYVIRTLNDDKPYDRFVQEQIAGDELWPDDPDALVATGFNRHYPDESNARNLKQRRQEVLNDITDTAGSVFLGVTYSCARCHDHKFDPVLQKDYYRLQAFFAASRAKDDYVLATPPQQAAHAEKLAEWKEATRDIREQLDRIEAPILKAIYDENFSKYPAEIQEAVRMEPARRGPMEWLMFHKASWLLDSKADEDGNGIRQKLKGEPRAEWEALRAKLAAFDPIKPEPLPIGSGLADVGAEAPPTHVLSGGAYDRPRAEVPPGVLTILDPAPARIVPPPDGRSTGRRTALARWLTDPANPLVARVMANRIWHYHFGRGIVGTPSDFGVKGDERTHPELLDWLAATFVDRGWSLKQMHRLIMLSSTYRQSSAGSPLAAKADPDDRLLWRFPRHRLTGEEIRDAILAVSGQLNAKVGGPSVFPDLPPGMEVRGGWKKDEKEEEKNRRSVYVFVRRNSRYPLFQAFDMPDTVETCARRATTTTAPQALSLLNDNTILRAAQSFAGRVLEEAPPGWDARVSKAYRLAFSRDPAAEERTMARAFLSEQARRIEARLAEDRPVALPAHAPADVSPAQAAALVDFCHVLVNANEFVYVN